MEKGLEPVSPYRKLSGAGQEPELRCKMQRVEPRARICPDTSAPLSYDLERVASCPLPSLGPDMALSG